MQNISGFAKFLAIMKFKEQADKPFFGKPYMKYGQCLFLWSYFFQLAGILGAKHSDKLDAFGHAFLGVSGPSDSVKKYFKESAKLAFDSVRDSTTFMDFVGEDFIKFAKYEGNAINYLLEHGKLKIFSESVIKQTWYYSEQGATLGAIYPHIVRKMYERTITSVSKEAWKRAYSAGLNIPLEQQVMSYEETEKAENEAFMLYCKNCCPELYSILSK